jgi:hypothetical protein
MTEIAVYIYFDSETGRPYYHNPETNTETFDLPEGAIVFDPETQEEWIPPPASEAPVVDIPPEVASFTPPSGPPGFPHRDSSFFPDERCPYLPNAVSCDLQKFQIADYARQFFREHRTHNFTRKQISVESLTEFTTEPLTAPLLRALDPKLEKPAIKCFRWVLSYTGVDPQKNPAICADRIVQQLYGAPILRDEVMFQLIKQTQKNPNPVWLQRTWELFLIVVTLFPSTRDSEQWIKSHFSRNINHEDLTIRCLAQFCYIRFAARCAIGEPLQNAPIGYIHSIPTQFQTGHQQFGASIYEQIWNQRRSVTRLPIPYILHHMAEHLLKKGCEQAEGLFRLPGNMKHVEEMAEATNNGRDAISQAAMHDIASLFKKWFRDLPDPVVNKESLPRLRDAYDDKTYVEFVQTLPRAHMLTFMYLVGFLQRLVRSESATLMGAKNLAIVFGPNIVQTDERTEHEMKLFNDISRELIVALIETWDTSPMYPLNPDLLLEGSG